MCRSHRPWIPLVFLFTVVGAAIGLSGPTWSADLAAIAIQVDAHELPRRLVHTTLDIPCQPGPLRLWYPKWIPGTHGPKGRVEDVAGLRIETADGKSITWKRDEFDLHCFTLRVCFGRGRAQAR